MDFHSAPSRVLSQPICHRLGVDNLAKWPWAPQVHLFHYIDDILLTSDSLAELEKAATQVLSHLESGGWAISEAKLQEPALSVKFWGAVWSGKTKVAPDVVTDTIQAYLTPIQAL